MRPKRLRLAVAFVTVLALGAVTADEGFQPLVKGTDPAQFDLVGFGPDTIKIAESGEITVSGKPNGYFATKQEYHNYVLRFDWMYERPADLASDAAFDGNSGLLVHIQKPHKVWPQSIEVQLENKNAGDIFAIFGSKFKGKKDPAAQKKAIKPVGQWNEEEVTCQDGAIVCKINGIEVARGTGGTPDEGYIGLQSEGRPIHFRNIAIKTLK
ncbi:MAG TPA: DUF1080 domain-containing protein [Isosphaeraceae bacterium]|jgi:hypothetical protein|nr:DUF1080 domain-containing protein [Isosphaeraceae bacterium]